MNVFLCTVLSASIFKCKTVFLINLSFQYFLKITLISEGHRQNQYTICNLWASKVVHFFSRTVKLARAMEQLIKNSNGLCLDHHKYLHGIGNIKCFRRCQEREQKMISRDHRKRRRFRSRYWFALMILKGTYGEQFVKRTTWLQESKP